MQKQNYLTTNVILYCQKWEETVRFYRDVLCLAPVFSLDWFIEFSLNEKSRLSIANQAKSSIKIPGQKGITITLQVANIDRIWDDFYRMKIDPTPIKIHPWNAKVFYIFDPEGHRIEIWQEL